MAVCGRNGPWNSPPAEPVRISHYTDPPADRQLLRVAPWTPAAAATQGWARHSQRSAHVASAPPPPSLPPTAALATSVARRPEARRTVHVLSLGPPAHLARPVVRRES